MIYYLWYLATGIDKTGRGVGDTVYRETLT